jgi:hypothetical protein
MGEGLQNACAAALRSQLTDEHFAFLERLAEIERGGLLATRKWLPPADRKQDRIRQKCAKAGVVVWRFGYWALTGQGVALLRERGIESEPLRAEHAGA